MQPSRAKWGLDGEMGRVARLLRGLAIGAAALLLVVVGVRAWQAVTDPGLKPWHSVTPAEATAEEIAGMDWAAWTAREATVFEEVRTQVVDQLAPEDRTATNRYFAEGPLYSPRFAVDWNRSQILAPDGPPRGAVVLVHGLTDAPYSLRHVADLYRALGFVAVLPRMPGHGTVPGGLSAAVWPEWMAATRMAVREATALAGPAAPLHLVGYSNGGALVTKYALEALENPQLARPDQLVLLSPMIGVTAFARFAGLAGLPAVLPAFARAAWFDLIPEFNPFKYNSFPVQAAVQSHRLTQAVQADLRRLAADGTLRDLPPVLTFQSVVDSTVSTRAVVDALYARLPSNGSALVLFDLNRAAVLAPVLSAAAEAEIARLLPPAPRTYDVTVITNAGPGDYAAVALQEPAGATGPQSVPLGLDYPRDVFSLSHVAVPFPLDDGLYGLAPDPADDFGINVGTLAARGESGVLLVGSDMFARLYSNPFYAQMAARIAATVPPPP